MKLNWFKRGVIKLVSGIFYPVKIYGKENLKEGGAVVVCNHFSVIDCVYLVKLTLLENYSIIAKKELFKNKLFGKILKGFGAIPIDRENPELKTLLSTIKCLKNGEKVLLFPEGTRNKTGTTELQELKEGSAIFAVRAKCPIIPIMIYNKAKLFQRNKLIIGKPFEFDNFYDKKNTNVDYEEMSKIIYDKMRSEQKNLFELVDKKKKK